MMATVRYVASGAGDTKSQAPWFLFHRVYKWFIALCPKGKLVTGPVIIENSKPFYDEMKIIDKCTFSEGSKKKIPVRTYICRKCLITQNI
jgi:hypothetical protein